MWRLRYPGEYLPHQRREPCVEPRVVNFADPLFSTGPRKTEFYMISLSFFLKAHSSHKSYPQISFVTSAASCILKMGPCLTSFL